MKVITRTGLDKTLASVIGKWLTGCIADRSYLSLFYTSCLCFIRKIALVCTYGFSQNLSTTLNLLQYHVSFFLTEDIFHCFISAVCVELVSSERKHLCAFTNQIESQHNLDQIKSLHGRFGTEVILYHFFISCLCRVSFTSCTHQY